MITRIILRTIKAELKRDNHPDKKDVRFAVVFTILSLLTFGVVDSISFLIVGFAISLFIVFYIRRLFRGFVKLYKMKKKSDKMMKTMKEPKEEKVDKAIKDL